MMGSGAVNTLLRSLRVPLAVAQNISTRRAMANARGLSTVPCDNQSAGPQGEDDLVLVEKIGPVTTIGINRPQKRNCVNSVTARKLHEAFRKFEDDEEALVAVLHGTGGNFCAGFDLGQVSSQEATEDFARVLSLPGAGPMGPSRGMIKKPVIAAVDGYAVAGGLELALMCDLRVVEETAVMGVFCRRFGVPLIDGGTVRLPALIGLSRAMDLILTGRSIKAKEALEWGLANRVVACGTALGQALNLANSLVKFPQKCMLTDRRSAYHSTYSASTLDDAFAYELENGLPIVVQESIKGARRFVSGVGRHGKFHLDDPIKSNL